MPKSNPVSTPECLRQAREYAARPEVKERRRTRDLANAAKIAAAKKAWYEAHPEAKNKPRTDELRAYDAKWKREYRAKHLEQTRARDRAYEAAHPHRRKELSPERKQKAKEYRAAHAEEIRKQKAAWHKAHPQSPEKVARHLAWRRQSGWDKNRYHERKHDPHFKLKLGLRNRLYLAIKNGQKRGSAVALLGCSVAFLKTYLEERFQPGMTWANWSHKGWSIDHIRPLSLFDLTDPAQLALACHYTNLQPLWTVDNIRKGNKLCFAA